MIKRIFTILVYCLFVIGSLKAQQAKEILVGLESLPTYPIPEIQKAQKSSLELPFFDDFSRGLFYPTPDLWIGENVLVNTTYAINSKTLGVATFDAVNSKGQIHPNASVAPFTADTLTSLSINLNYTADTTIYFSFYFQPQGYGNQPDIKDSLLLEFYDPGIDKWIGVWASWIDSSVKKLYQTNKLLNRNKVIQSDTLNRTFFLVHFPVLDARYLVDGFRFRFRNIASVSPNTDIAGLRSNSDHWHVDMIYLDRNRTYKDTILNDVSYYKPLRSILRNYESMPWSHFNSAAKAAELPNPLGITIHYQNLGPMVWNVGRRFTIFNHSNGATFSTSGGAENINPYQKISFTRNYLYEFESTSETSAKFTFSSYLITDVNPETKHLRWNDTIRFEQSFQNYYAYDDGSAESGYGVYGEGSQNGRVALRYNSYKADYLVGVYIYFNRTFEDANEKYFKIAIWNDNNGKPGNIIYEQIGVKPVFTDSLNRFTLYKLNEQVMLPAGIFYIGWIQTTTDMLNVGFDLNRVNNSKLFYNLSGSWINSSFKGSLMIRPVFGELTENPTSDPLIPKERSIKIYPNPANDMIMVEIPNSNADTYISVFSLLGQQVLVKKYDNQAINISHLQSGTYLVRIVSDSKVIGTHKLIIVR
jgi:hypothetical protein